MADVPPAALALASFRPAARARVLRGNAIWRLGTLAPGASRAVRGSVRIKAGTPGLKRNLVLATAINAKLVDDRADTRLLPAAAAARPSPGRRGGHPALPAARSARAAGKLRLLELITAAWPEDPVLDIALTHALLREVAAGPPSAGAAAVPPRADRRLRPPRRAARRVRRGGPASARARLHARDPARRRPRRDLRRALRTGRAGHGRGRRDRRAAGALPAARRAPQDRPRRRSERTRESASCGANTAPGATASMSAGRSRWPGSRSAPSAAPR